MSNDEGVSAVRALMAADAAIVDGLGIEAVDVEPGQVTLGLTVGETMINSQRMCHGGFLFTLADTAAAYAAASTGAGPATLEANIAYLRPARAGERVSARAEVIHSGSRVGHCEVRITRQDGELLAVFRSSWLTG